MVAADSVALAEKKERAARAKAVAWAWYQRSGGSSPPTAGRSDAFATRCATRRATSRFQREAASRLRTLAIAASFTSTASDSPPLTSFSTIANSSSLSHQCSASFEDAIDPEDLSSSSDLISNSEVASCLESSGADQENRLALVALHPRACWDCGSTLFDSFELVAMAKSLDAELQNLNLDSDTGNQDDCNTDSSSGFGSGSGLDRQHQQALLPCDSISPPPSPPQPHLYDSDEAYDAIFDTRDKLASPPDTVLSKQEVYDMFCQYRDASKHGAESIVKQSPAETTCAADQPKPKKKKVKSGRMSLHLLAKALHNLRHPSSNLGSDSKLRDYHHHHRPHQKAGSRSLSMQGNGGHLGASRLGEWFSGDVDVVVDKPQHQKARHVHHHHHHHYHYLFHTDDDFWLQPLDKSLMVAAAGLRSPKVNPTPSRGDYTVDYGRKWADLGTLHTSVGTNLD